MGKEGMGGEGTKEEEQGKKRENEKGRCGK